MASPVLWEHEAEVRFFLPRPNNATVAESGRRLRLKI